MNAIRFHSEQRIGPSAREILGLAVRAVFGEDKVAFKKVDKPAPGVLCFGTRGNGGIRTLSPKQISTVPNALTVLEQSLRLYRDGIHIPEMDYRVVSTHEEFTDTLEWMNQHGFDAPVCVDIENAPDKSLLSIAVTYGQEIVVFPEEYVQGHYLHFLCTTLSWHYYIIGANWKYDAGVLLDHTGIKLPVWFDTMLAHHSLHPSATGQHGLKAMAERILGIADWDKDIQKYTGAGSKDKPKDFSKVPRDLLYKYIAYDVFYTFLLYLHFLPLVEYHDAFWTEIQWANGFIDIEANRAKIDMDYVTDFRDHLMAQEEEHLALLPGGLNPRSPKQLKELLEARLGEPLASTDAKTLEAIQDVESVADIVKPLLAYRAVMKQRSTYCDAYLRYEQDGFIRPTINIHGTSSGRMSGSDPNVQNVPRDKKVRHIFIARSNDRVLIETDYSQAELRVQAVLSGDPAMIAAFQPGAGDFFDLLMPVAFPQKYASLAAFKGHKTEHKSDAKEDRAKIKGVIYGLNFGRGARAIGDALKMPEEDAQEIIDNFMSAYPTYAKWRERVLSAAIDPEDRGFLTGPSGLQFDSEVITYRNKSNIQRSALSFLPQNYVSFLCTTAAVRVNYRLKCEYPEALVTMAIHDAVYVDAPETLAQEVGDLVQFEMEQVGREVFGDVVPFTAEPEWAYRWSDLVE